MTSSLVRRTALGATAAGVVALAAVATAHASDQPAGQPATAPHLAAHLAADPAATSAGSAAPGPGWTVAGWAPSASRAGTLFLIDPSGRRRAVSALPKQTSPVAWSGDGQRVIVQGGSGYWQVSLRTGQLTRLRLPASAQVLGYTRPRGLALRVLVEEPVPGSHGRYVQDRLTRYGLDGRRQATYPAVVAGAGRLQATAPAETPDGGLLVAGADHGAVVLGNDGSVQRRLLTGERVCTPGGWWRSGVALVSCRGTLWAAPVSGARASRITAPPSATEPLGYTTAWRVSHGTLGMAASGCGPETLVRIGADGIDRPVTVPAPIPHAGRPVMIGHAADRVVLRVSPGSGCTSGADTLFAWNAVTGRSTALLGPGVNGGTVTGAVVRGDG